MRTARDLSVIALLLVVSAACTTDRTRRGYLRQNAARLTPPERVVIVIPGFGVTRLFDPVTRRHVWGTGRAMLHTRFADDLDLPIGEDGEAGRDRLVPRGYAGSRGPVNVAWQLIEALRRYGGYRRGIDVYGFEYDWRLSARDNARELAAFADRVSPGRRVDLVTHSAGAMIALTYVKLTGGDQRVDRLVMIAPTQRGVADALRVFIRPERFLRRTFHPDVVATWPFIYELLPESGEFILRPDGAPAGFDAWTPASWALISSGRYPVAPLLNRARDLRDELARSEMPPAVRATVIAGDCVPTARAVLLRRDGSFVFYISELRPEEEHLAHVLFEPGDGTVPVSSAVASATDVHLFCDGHQGLASDPSVHRAILRALDRDR